MWLLKRATDLFMWKNNPLWNVSNLLQKTKIVKKNVATILKDIKTELNKPWENQTKIDYLTAREYNWSSTKNSYAMNVLVSKKLNELIWEKSE